MDEKIKLLLLEEEIREWKAKFNNDALFEQEDTIPLYEMTQIQYIRLNGYIKPNLYFV